MEFYSIAAFVFITSITPGPNNISSFIFSLEYGYKNVVNYLLGIASGTFALFFLCAISIEFIIGYVHQISYYLKYFAFLYILFLAFKSLKFKNILTNKPAQKPSFLNGFMLQLINPKALLFGVTIYSTFLSSILHNKLHVLLSATALAINTFLMISIWALSGHVLLKYINNPKIARGISIAMALALVLFAIKILDVL